jgi:hypothetical protein
MHNLVSYRYNKNHYIGKHSMLKIDGKIINLLLDVVLMQEHKKNVFTYLKSKKVSEKNKIAAALLEKYTKNKFIHLIHNGNSIANISKILNIKYNTVRSILGKEKINE